MKFSYEIQKNSTIITIKVDYSIFGGRGFIWRFPQETIDSWARLVNVTPTKLLGNQSFKYLELDHLQTLIADRTDSKLERFCPQCGEKDSILILNCVRCGALMN